MPCPRTQQASLPACSPHYPFFMLSTKQGSYEYHFLKSFGMTRLRNEPKVYRLQCGRSNHCTIAPVPLLHRSFYLKLCGRSGRNCLLSPPVLSGYNGSPNTRFSRESTQLMSWPDGERYLRSPLSLVVSLFLSLVSTLFFSRTGDVLSHRNSLTHRFPRNLRSLVTLAVFCVLSRLRCNGHSHLLGSYLSRIDRIEIPSCSACGHSSQDTSHLILHCPATDSLRRSLFGDSLSLYDLWFRPWGVARILGLHGLPPCPHPSEGVG